MCSVLETLVVSHACNLFLELHYLVNVLFCNDAHILPHQNEFLDLTHKSPEKGPPVPRDKR